VSRTLYGTNASKKPAAEKPIAWHFEVEPD
jgi:hypothetical protein